MFSPVSYFCFVSNHRLFIGSWGVDLGFSGFTVLDLILEHGLGKRYHTVFAICLDRLCTGRCGYRISVGR